MIRNKACVIVVSLWMLTVVFAGCANRSPLGQTSAPAATGLAAAAAEIPRMARAAPISIPWPAPKDFGVTPELTPIHFDFDKFDIRPGDAVILNAHAR